MNIRILHLLEGARAARGTAVVIDVFRAFSLECYLTAAGVRDILPVADAETARRLGAAHPDWVLAGERRGFRLPGFALGNSPAKLAGLDLAGKTVVHTTSAGTQGIENARGADRILTGSLVNAAAIARYLRAAQPETVSLVCMGIEMREIAPEDLLCAEYIRALLLDEPLDVRPRAAALRETSGARFFLPDQQEDCPSRDFTLCTDVDRFPFVLEIVRDGAGLCHARRIDV